MLTIKEQIEFIEKLHHEDASAINSDYYQAVLNTLMQAKEHVGEEVISNTPTLKLKNFEIAVSGLNHKTHDLYELPEELCQEMVDKHDSGERYSASSRYTYTTKLSKNHKGIPFGTAKAAVQNAIIKFFGSGVRNLIIKQK